MSHITSLQSTPAWLSWLITTLSALLGREGKVGREVLRARTQHQLLHAVPEVTYKVSIAIWYEVVHKNLAVHNVYTWVKGRLRTGPMVYTTVMQSAVT